MAVDVTIDGIGMPLGYVYSAFGVVAFGLGPDMAMAASLV